MLPPRPLRRVRSVTGAKDVSPLMTHRHWTALALATSLFSRAVVVEAQHHHRHHRDREEPTPAPPAAASPAATATPAAATPDAEDAEYQPAIEAANRGQRDEALGLFRAIYERTHAPRAIARMGLTEKQLGRWLPAEEHLRAALAAGGDPWITSHRAPLEEAMEQVRQNLADLEVVCAVPGATLSVNGQAAGTLPLAHPIRIVRGSVMLDVVATGYEPNRQVITVNSASGRAEATLIRETALTVSRRQVVVPSTVQVDAGTSRAASGVLPSAGNGTLRALGIASLVLGGAGLATGVAGVVLHNGAVDDFTTRGCWLEGSTAMGADAMCSDLYSSGDGMQTLAVAGFVVGGVGIAAGVTMLLVSPGRRSGDVARWSCGRGPGDFGVSCGGVF